VRGKLEGQKALGLHQWWRPGRDWAEDHRESHNGRYKLGHRRYLRTSGFYGLEKRKRQIEIMIYVVALCLVPVERILGSNSTVARVSGVSTGSIGTASVTRLSMTPHQRRSEVLLTGEGDQAFREVVSRCYRLSCTGNRSCTLHGRCY
jgi:hypothetical protein